MSQIAKTDFLILCGGLGKRLRSAIGESQKVMAAVGEEPFLNIYLKNIYDQGIRRVVLCTGYRGDLVEDYYTKWNKPEGLRIEFSHESEPLGTGGAIKNARSRVTSDPFFAANGDAFAPQLGLQEFLEFHQAQKALATLAVNKANNAGDFGTISLAPDRRIMAFEEKKAADSVYLNVGVYCFQKKIFDHMPAAASFSIEKDFFPALVDQKFYGYETEGKFLDIGTPERYGQAKAFFKKG